MLSICASAYISGSRAGPAAAASAAAGGDHQHKKNHNESNEPQNLVFHLFDPPLVFFMKSSAIRIHDSGFLSSRLLYKRWGSFPSPPFAFFPNATLPENEFCPSCFSKTGFSGPGFYFWRIDSANAMPFGGRTGRYKGEDRKR
jgi:hypothetical protein